MQLPRLAVLLALLALAAATEWEDLEHSGQWDSDASSADLSFLKQRTQHNVRTPSHKFKSLTAKSNGRMGFDSAYTYKSVCVVDGVPKVLHGFDCRNQVAVGRFKNAINASGWSYLEVETFAEGNAPELQAYAAGVLEGTLSREVIRFALANTFDDYCTGYTAFCKRLFAYMRANLEYVRGKIEHAKPDDPYWQSVKRSYLQLTGVLHGYRDAPFNVSISYDVHPIMLINANGDFYDLEKKFNKTKDPLTVGGKCSGLVKVAPGNADIFISQVTMSGFQNLLRVLKLYKFAYDKELFPGATSSFASYPGMLYSSDDFALMSSGLAVIETTISVYNRTLFDAISPKGQLLCWVRAIAANQLARNAREWCHLFKRYNSGTYNNQWVVLDYQRFTPRQPLPGYGLLYVLEQLPGAIVYKDMSAWLKEKTYVASYNIPLFAEVSRLSGFDEQAKKTYWSSWSDCPRAKIFARDHANVTDLDSLTKLMRYNDYQHEEFARCNCTPPYNAEAAISARGDLNWANGTYPVGPGHVNHGALDYKGTNYALARQLRFRALSSPAYDDVPPFKWSATDLALTVKHVGHPDEWHFAAVEYQWETKV